MTRTTAILSSAMTALALAVPSTATATTPTGVLALTAQAQQADAAFLAYAPAPVAGAGALCLVDTGVNSNPDTAPGLIGSYAIDSGATTDVDPDGHGTTMAMIAGGAGKGILGAWPRLKIVSVRATNVPSLGKEPQFEFNDYWQGMNECLNYAAADRIRAVDLALASQIPPSSDQATSFATTVGNLEGQNIAVIAAAGNTPGAVEEPGAEPNVLAVGASTAQAGTLSATTTGAVCSFSADNGISLYAPGCGVDAADPFTDAPLCCDDGTSEASAFTAAVIVALMSYDPTITYTKAEQLLISTANNGDLDVAGAFRADGLGQIVTEGTADIPQTTTTSTTTTATPTTATSTTTTTTSTASHESGQPAAKTGGTAKPSYPVKVRSVRWNRGLLTVQLSGMPRHATAILTLTYIHGRALGVLSSHATIRIRTRRPHAVTVRVIDGRTVLSATTTVVM